MTKFKKTLFFSSLLTPIFATPVIAASCTQENKELKLNKTFVLENPSNDYHKVGNIFDKQITYSILDSISGTRTKKTSTLWDYFTAFEGNVVSQADGDTVTVQITKAPSNPKAQSFAVGNTVRIRIPLIDTLESPSYSQDEEEGRLSDIDSAYIANLLEQSGNRVRVIVDSIEKSYDRYVGYVFFGENFEKNWSVEMLAAGFTLARFSGGDFNFFKSDYDTEVKSKISSYLLPFAATAATDGIKNKLGFYNGEYGIKTVADLSTKYKTHGGQGLLINTYTLLNPSLIPSADLKGLDGRNVYQFIWQQMDKK